MYKSAQLGQLSQPLSHLSKCPNTRETAGTAKIQLGQLFNPSVPVSRSLGTGTVGHCWRARR